MRLPSTPNLYGFDNLDVFLTLQLASGLPVYINKDVNLLLLCGIAVNDLQNEDILTEVDVCNG